MKTGYIIYSGKTNLIKKAYVFCLVAICNPRPPRCTVLSFKGEISLLMIIINKYFRNLISSDHLQFVFHCAAFSEIQTNDMLINLPSSILFYYFIELNWTWICKYFRIKSILKICIYSIGNNYCPPVFKHILANMWPWPTNMRQYSVTIWIKWAVYIDLSGDEMTSLIPSLKTAIYIMMHCQLVSSAALFGF